MHCPSHVPVPIPAFAGPIKFKYITFLLHILRLPHRIKVVAAENSVQLMDVAVAVDMLEGGTAAMDVDEGVNAKTKVNNTARKVDNNSNNMDSSHSNLNNSSAVYSRMCPTPISPSAMVMIIFWTCGFDVNHDGHNYHRKKYYNCQSNVMRYNLPVYELWRLVH